MELIGRGVAWLDTGRPTACLRLKFHSHHRKRQGLKIACIEEVAYNMGFITKNDLWKLAESLPKGAYRDYLLTLL